MTSFNLNYFLNPNAATMKVRVSTDEFGELDRDGGGWGAYNSPALNYLSSEMVHTTSDVSPLFRIYHMAQT